MPEHNSISVCVYNENDGLLELGNRINERFEEAYMNGYNWAALIHYYVSSVDPELMEEVQLDPEAGMFSAYLNHSAANLQKMKRFETHLRTMLADDETLLKFIEQHYEDIQWD